MREVFEKIRARISSQRERYTAKLENGAADDYPGYREIVGRLKQLRDLSTEIDNIEDQHRKGEGDE